MNIKDIINLTENVEPYEKGTHTMWTESHISKYLLEAHINPDINLASRTSSGIDKIVEFLIKESGSKCKDILDLGCGPGLYTNKLAQNGYNVVGIDFSKRSIEYAKKQAIENDLDIKYMCQNYLEMDFDNKFDLITMIYCDFGVLSQEERDILVRKIYKALKPGGYFIFDTLNKKAIQNINIANQWEMSNGGFWSEKPYLCLSQTLHFPKNKAILDQHIVVDEKDDYKIYRFWNHYLDKKDVKDIFEEIGFKNTKEYTNMLKNDGLYNDEGVSFYKIEK